MANERARRGTPEALEPAPEAPTFGAAVDEIETILARLEREEVDIDDLAAEVRRAVELIGLCRRKLASTELEVRAYVDSLQQADAPLPSSAPLPAPPEPDDEPGDRLPF